MQRFKLRMPIGAHHFGVLTYNGNITDDSKFPATPVESVGCVGFAPDDLFPGLLIPTQSPNTEFRFPKGIAIHLEPHEQVLLNTHIHNFGTEAVVPDVRFNVYRAKKGTVRHYVEGITFGNSSDISVPAGGDQTLFVEWTLPIPLTIVAIATHQHSHGTYASIEVVHEDGVGRDLLVETSDWRHPPSVQPQGGLRLEQGRKLRLTCKWHNDTDHELRFGPKTTDEMCYGVGFVYRDEGDTAPIVGSGCVPSKKGVLCPLVPAVPD